MRYLQDMMDKVPDSIPKDERIWFALAAYNMGYAHMLDAMALTRKQKGNPNSWADVKLRLPLLSQKPYYSKLKYGYARGHEAYAYVENIRKYQISLVGYLSEKERQQQQTLALAEDYPAVLPNELEQPQETTLPFFKFRADKQMDNARMKLPATCINFPRSAPGLSSALFLSRRQRKKSLSMAEQDSASTPSLISTRWFIPGWCRTSISEPAAPVLASGAKHQAGDTAVHHRARAHDAGLEGHVQRGVDQAVVLQHQSALA